MTTEQSRDALVEQLRAAFQRAGDYGDGAVIAEILPIIAAERAAVWEAAAKVAENYLHANAANVDDPLMRERYGPEATEHAREHLTIAAVDLAAAIRAQAASHAPKDANGEPCDDEGVADD